MAKSSSSAALALATPLRPSLPSWNDGPAKQAIVDFVERITRKGGPHYVRHEERIAVFDDDGTLWPERPMYVQAAFAIDRMKLLASQHARWTEAPLASAILAGDFDVIATAGERQIQEILALTHAGLCVDDFQKIIVNWLNVATHPLFRRGYIELFYAPMRDLIDYLRCNGFKIFIASCSGVEFVRVFAEQIYDIPPERIVGSWVKSGFEFHGNGPLFVKQSRIECIDEGPGKAVGIERFVGRRPIFAVGNSDADQQVLQWVARADRPNFVALVHHTDFLREFAYDRDSKIGRLARALLEARARNWTVIDMAKDWAQIFPDARTH